MKGEKLNRNTNRVNYERKHELSEQNTIEMYIIE